MLPLPEAHWISERPGPNFAFLPGMIMAPAVWQHFAPDFAKQGRSVAYPLPAHYPWRTARSGGELLSTEEIVDAYAGALGRDFANGATTDRVTLVGHSTGGFIALLLALRFPHLVRGLVLVGSFASGRFESRGLMSMRILDWPVLGEVLFKRLLSRWVSSPERFRQGSLACVRRRDASWEGPEAARTQEAVRAAMMRSDLAEIAELVRWLSHQDIMDRLPAIDAPCLCVIGARDPIVPPVHQIRMARRIPDAVSVVMPGVGHLPMAEAPQSFQQVVEIFLASAFQRRAGRPPGGPVGAAAGPLRQELPRPGRDSSNGLTAFAGGGAPAQAQAA